MPASSAMPLPHRSDTDERVDVGFDCMAFVKALFPLARSLTGDGVRKTLQEIAQYIPVSISEVTTGTPVLDWHVPKEWNIRSASIRSLSGETLIDFAYSNLHVVGYSRPISAVLSREELARHVYTLPDQPDAIPYRTGYYADDWGFCMQDSRWRAMQDDMYAVEIDSDLKAGHLTYGELLVPGLTDNEILISVHICHPSLANDNLSGIAVATALARQLLLTPGRMGVRFLFIPATIGAVTWLARNEAILGRIKHGMVLTCLGDAGGFHYKSSRRGAEIDSVASHVLARSPFASTLLPFTPYGYDERQYCSPGFDLPIGCLMRGVHGQFPEYHTSLDDCSFVGAAALDESLVIVSEIVSVLQRNVVYERIDGRGEPQLGERGLYRAIAGQKEAGGANQMDLLWLLNLADGHHSLLDIARRADTPFDRIDAAAALALTAGLVRVSGS
ncbi:aminopeptidase-like protein [Sphingomonas faeni]|uniref:Aminopeptidase-like protein n=2 Tax=Sphingomonas faeni TaxID=185950 RepID=A0A2T5TY73_9SPHN|nr:aminopeptidase-like protein [Sphingomonas faeni]